MTPSSNQTLRVGVVGLGFGAAIHAPTMLAQPGVELVGIAGRSAERAQKIADDLHIKKGFGSVDALLACDLDAITIALPPDQNHYAVRAALQAGVAVLCEKPLATNANKAAELAMLADKRITAMDFIFGELETFTRLRNLIDSKKYGAVRSVQVTWLTQSWAYRNQNWSWKTDKAQGGGVIALLGTHLFFLAEWLLGCATAVRAYTSTPLAEAFAPMDSEAAEDLFTCLLSHDNDITLSATVGNASPGKALHRWTVVFEHATAVLENVGADYVANFILMINDGNKVEKLREPESSGDGRLVPFTKLASRFLHAVRTKTPMLPDLAVGARVQHIDAAVRASILSGKDVFLE